jgi:hypothetical protein
MNTKFLRPLILSALGVLAVATASANPIAIGNKNLSGEQIDPATLKAAFLGKRIAWQNAGRVTLAILRAGSTAEKFLKVTVDMSPSQFTNHWRRLAMTGGANDW